MWSLMVSLSVWMCAIVPSSAEECNGKRRRYAEFFLVLPVFFSHESMVIWKNNSDIEPAFWSYFLLSFEGSLLRFLQHFPAIHLQVAANPLPRVRVKGPVGPVTHGRPKGENARYQSRRIPSTQKRKTLKWWNVRGCDFAQLRCVLFRNRSIKRKTENLSLWTRSWKSRKKYVVRSFESWWNLSWSETMKIWCCTLCRVFSSLKGAGWAPIDNSNKGRLEKVGIFLKPQKDLKFGAESRDGGKR